MTRTCKHCDKTKPIEMFGTYYNGDEMKRRWMCKACRQAGRKPNSPERLEQMRAAAFLRKYGLSKDQYIKMFRDRDGLCDICKKPETRRVNGKLLPLCVDHDAQTGHVRGLLCSNCNVGIGLLHHDPVLLHRAVAYLGGQ